jgi:hypothetical protein
MTLHTRNLPRYFLSYVVTKSDAMPATAKSILTVVGRK